MDWLSATDIGIVKKIKERARKCWPAESESSDIKTPLRQSYPSQLALLLISSLVLSSCGGGGSGGSPTGSSNSGNTDPSPTLTLSSDVDNAFVGEAVTLIWSSTNATACEASGDWSGTKSVSGEESVTLTQTGTLEFNLMCSNSSRNIEALLSVTAVAANVTGRYRQDDGTDIYVDASTQSLFQMPLNEQYLTEKYQGYTYGTGVVFGPGYWGDRLHSCEISDLNRDGNPDAVAITNILYSGGDNAEEDNKFPEIRSRIHFFLNNGDGTFSDGSSLINGSAHHRVTGYKEAHKGDLNNDGLDDFLMESAGSGGLIRGNGMLVLMSQPDGTWKDETSRVQFGRRTDIQRRNNVQEDVLGANGGPLMMFDLDGDGYKDLFNLMATQEEGGLPTVFLSDDAEVFSPWDRWDAEENRYRGELLNGSMRAGDVVDFDNDGDEDIVLLCYNKFCFGDPEEAYYADRESFYPWQPFQVDSSNGFVILNEDGELKMENSIHFPKTPYENNTKNDDMDVGDLNGDGFPDIVTAYGKSEPYYVDRKIQILINDGGSSLLDETDTRMPVDERTDSTGHAEGSIKLIDLDGDNDLDIIDFQTNVRGGKYYDNVCDCEVDYPYGRHGHAIFINDGTGNFSYLDKDIFDVSELRSLDEGDGYGWVGDGLYDGFGGIICPIDFGGNYGRGWLYQFGYENDVRNAENAGVVAPYSIESFGVTRELTSSDAFR